MIFLKPWTDIYEERIDKPWGHELIISKNENYVVKVLYIKSGERLSFQYHEVKEETLFYYAGIGYVIVIEDGKEVIYNMSHDGKVHIKPMTKHRIVSSLFHDLVLLEVSTNHLDDVVRIEDDYNRVL